MNAASQLAASFQRYDSSGAREARAGLTALIDTSREFATWFLKTARHLERAGFSVPRKVTKAAKKLGSATTSAEFHLGVVLSGTDTIVAWLGSLGIEAGEQKDG